MHGRGKSDSPAVPKTPPNKGGGAPSPAEGAEGRGLAKGNPGQHSKSRTQSRTGADRALPTRARSGKPRTRPRDGAYVRSADLSHALDRIRQAAAKDRGQRFTALWHHVYDVGRLREEYYNLKPRAAPGVDGETWQEYGENLEARLQDLSERLRRGAYRAQPVRRVYIPKADGRQRPIGIPALEDKLVQRSATAVLQAVYEVDFKGFSYGFRPGRGAHDALDALAVGIHARRVNWMLDADVRGFFDAISHEWLVQFVEHRIADRCVVRHIRKWLKAGVLEDGQWMRSEAGTPQGGSISPLLANIYLHYAFDLWAEWWRSHQASGDVIVVRYADDFVVGFEHRSDAERFQADLAERFRKFALELHADKTRLIEFGRHAARTRSARGAGKPETFDFLGFTHVCGTTRKGKFIVVRRPMQKRVRRTLAAIKEVLRRRLHHSIAEVGQWLGTVMRGWYQYYAVPLTSPQLGAFRTRVGRLWYGALRRRSYKTRITWERMHRLIACWLPEPRILHPYPWERLRV